MKKYIPFVIMDISAQLAFGIPVGFATFVVCIAYIRHSCRRPSIDAGILPHPSHEEGKCDNPCSDS